jgi:hypothetical protein
MLINVTLLFNRHDTLELYYCGLCPSHRVMSYRYLSTRARAPIAHYFLFDPLTDLRFLCKVTDNTATCKNVMRLHVGR